MPLLVARDGLGGKNKMREEIEQDSLGGKDKMREEIEHKNIDYC
jgi:hypothetical protein